jgi:hypothetical protein
MWANMLTLSLNGRLPEEYYAVAVVRFGIEIDVATYRPASSFHASEVRDAVAISSWSVPEPALTAPLPVLVDEVEVRIFRQIGGPHLAGAIELVSPANKDRPAHRDAFTAKCATLLHQGVGVLIVDVVTERRANLHTELLNRLRVPEVVEQPWHLYSSSYHPVQREGQTCVDIWQEPLAVGSPMKTMPLFLKDGPHVPIELQSTYESTLTALRIQSGDVLPDHPVFEGE